MSKGIILFADNNVDFCYTRKEFLEAEGYEVVTASNPQEAEAILQKRRIHLAIIDLRLTDDSDDDISGLTLVKESDPITPKMILTAYPTWQDVREALGPLVDGLTPAVDFLAKQDGPGVMIETVKRIFQQHVRINWDLQIQWDPQHRLSFLHLAKLLFPKSPNELVAQRADELEDLLRLWFYDYRQIRIGRVLWHEGQRVCLPILARSREGTIDRRVLVCGERGRMREELYRMQRFAPTTADGVRPVSMAGGTRTETPQLGAAVYELPDVDLETLQPLREVYASATERTLVATLGHLLTQVLQVWHGRGDAVEGVEDLMALYRRWTGLQRGDLSRTEVTGRVAGLLQVSRPLSNVGMTRQQDGSIRFQFPGEPARTYPDPVATVYTPPPLHGFPVVCKISPGQLTTDNILVDGGRRAWLTDFAHAGQAPQWWDYVCLEAIIRFDLSQAPDLLAWQEFEECLVRPVDLHERLRSRDVIPALRTSVALIDRIRRQAGGEAGADPAPYYAGLLCWAVGAMARYDPAVLYTESERMRGAHLLLAAAMLARRLGKTMPRDPADGPLQLDEDGTVSIGDRPREVLAGQELDLLRCLLERADQLVTRETIAESVFAEAYEPHDKHQQGRINSLVARLRAKLEPDPGRPRYLVTLKGKGYRLTVSPEADGS